MTISRFLSSILLWILAISQVSAQIHPGDILPPTPPWSGKSRVLALPPDHLWATPFEKGNMLVSPSFDETMAWLERLVAASPKLAMITIGKTLQGRLLKVVIASKERAFTAQALADTGKPTLFAHAGIHAGEIDGKDAGMMLLRDMTVTPKLAQLLDHANFLFLPILNADGHERASAFNRINQRGPKVMGWRTNGRNLNLNRDYTKLDTLELRALIPFLDRWNPDLYFDIHVTDGIDYQYDITYGFTASHGSSPAATQWMSEVMRPALDAHLLAMGHEPGPLIFANDRLDLTKGLKEWTPGPRYSNGYGNLRHLPTVLVENHSLKPYDQRVLGTYLLLEATLRTLSKSGKQLREAIVQDRARRPKKVITGFVTSEEPAGMFKFKTIRNEINDSKISGSKHLSWLGEPLNMEVPWVRVNKPAGSVDRPEGYYIPPDWPEVIENLRLHGVIMEVLDQPRELDVMMYRLKEPVLDRLPFEGRVRVSARAILEPHHERFPAGSVWVSTDQPLAELIVLLLEPDSPDSLWQWGFFLEIIQATEYFEAYAVEPLAHKMLNADAQLKLAFEAKLAADSDFAKSPRKRLDFFYQKSPYADKRWRLYPLGLQFKSEKTSK